jgi:ribonuclease-3
MASIEALEDRLGYSFADRSILHVALTHTSAIDGKPNAASNERLEFLGDRVLGIVIADWLYRRFPEAGEDGLAPRLNALVNRNACARAARAMGLGEFVRLSPSEEASGGRQKETILADACEAVIAAVFLDGGLAPSRALIEAVWADQFGAVTHAPRDPKTALQELAAAQARPMPVYTVLTRDGPDHAPRFTIEAHVPGIGRATGDGANKRDGEREAARALLKQVGIDV